MANTPPSGSGIATALTDVGSVLAQLRRLQTLAPQATDTPAALAVPPVATLAASTVQPAAAATHAAPSIQPSGTGDDVQQQLVTASGGHAAATPAAPPVPPYSDAQKRSLLRYVSYSRAYVWMHRRESSVLKWSHDGGAMLSIVLTTVIATASTSNFSLKSESLSLALGIIGFIVTVLTNVNKHFDFARMSEKHTQAAQAFGRFKNYVMAQIVVTSRHYGTVLIDTMEQYNDLQSSFPDNEISPITVQRCIAFFTQLSGQPDFELPELCRATAPDSLPQSLTATFPTAPAGASAPTAPPSTTTDTPQP